MTKRRLLDRHQVEHMVRMARSTLYQAMAEGRFPKPIRVSKRGVRWIEDEVLEWIASRKRGGSS